MVMVINSNITHVICPLLFVFLTGDARSALMLADKSLQRHLFITYGSANLSDPVFLNSMSCPVREIVDFRTVLATCRDLGFDSGKEENVLKVLTPLALFFLVSLVVSECGIGEPATVSNMFSCYNAYRATKHLNECFQSELLLLISELQQKNLLKGGEDKFGKRFQTDATRASYQLYVNPEKVLLTENLLEMYKSDLRNYIKMKKKMK